MSDLRRLLDDRLEVLRREHEIGEARLHALQNELTTVEQTLLRISGAIQVLEECSDAATLATSIGEPPEAATTPARAREVA